MASGSRGYRPRSLRMSASAGAPDDEEYDEPLPQHLVDLPSADLVARLRSLLAASSADSSDATHILAELERRHHEAEDRVRVSEELAATMRERVKVLQRSATAAHEKIRRAAETEARLRAEIDSQKHTAAGHQPVLETLEQRAVVAEAQFRRASDSEALLETKIRELEDKAATVEAKHQREMEAIEGRVVKAEGELKEANKTAMNFKVRLEAIISEAEHAAAILEVSHGLQIQVLESRVTELESSLGHEMTHRDRMATLATHFEARVEVIASEAKHAADGVKDSYRVEIEALQQLVTETKECLSDEIGKREALASECQQHLKANDISEGECVTNEKKAELLSKMISEGTKKAAELDSEISHTAAEIRADLRRAIEEGEDTMAELKASIAKNGAMAANESYEEDGQQRSSPTPTHMPSAQTSEHHDVVDLTTSEDDV